MSSSQAYEEMVMRHIRKKEMIEVEELKKEALSRGRSTEIRI